VIDKRRTAQQRYREAHREELRERARQYRATGKHREAAHRYRQRHPDRVRASQERYRDAHRQLLRDKAVYYYERNKCDSDFMERRRESNRRSYARRKQRQRADDLRLGTPHAKHFGCQWTGDTWQKPCDHSRTYKPCRKCVAAAKRFVKATGVSGCSAVKVY
jgi:hypothetical protein